MGLKDRFLGRWFAIFVLSVGSLAGAIGDLAEAVKARDGETVRSLLKQQADVNVPLADGSTALQWAAHWDDLETAQLLIAAGANVNAADEYGVTPLTLACTNANAVMVETLLKADAKPGSVLPTGETALMTCARSGNAEAVKSLLARGADVNAKESRLGQTALMWAVSQKHPEVVKALIEHGSDFNAGSKTGFTAMLFAARVGDVESARILVEAGANVNEVTPIQGNPEAKTTPLLLASASTREALAIFLLEKGADPNAWDGRFAPLHYVMKGYAYLHFRPSMPELAKALLARGADPNVRGAGRGGSAGATPFWMAAAAPDPNMMRILLAGGADPKLASRTNVTPLMAAAGVGRAEDFTEAEQMDALEAVKLMVELGSDINAVNDTGRIALHGSSNLGANLIIQYLIDQGAKLDVKDKYQQTPLSIASGIHLPWTPKGEELGEVIRPATADLFLKAGATPVNTPGYFTPPKEDSDAYRLNPKRETPGLN